MALKKEAKDALVKLGIDVDKLIEAVKADAETDLTVPSDVTVIKTTELEARDANKIAEGKRLGEPEGEKKGRELAAKAFRKKFALDDAIGNDVDKVVEAVNTKLNKGDAALQEQVAALLKDKETLAGELTTEKGKAKQAQFDATLISMFPANRSADLKDSERLALMKMELAFEEVDGKTVVKRGGQIVNDPNTHAALGLEKVIPDYFTERKWVGAAGPNGGRGGGDALPGGTASGIKNASKFEEKWLAENPGKSAISPEYTDALNKHAKDIPDFNMYG